MQMTRAGLVLAFAFTPDVELLSLAGNEEVAGESMLKNDEHLDVSISQETVIVRGILAGG